MINEYCRDYRISKNISLKEVTNGSQIKTISAFEMGRSSNVKHLESYIKLSVKLGDEKNFINGLINKFKVGYV